MQIRSVKKQDFEQWAVLWRGYLSFYDTARDVDHIEWAFAHLLSDDSNSYSGFVAEHEGRLVGLTHFVHHAHMWDPAGVIYLQDLYVADTVRGTGAGRALIEAVYAHGDMLGVPKVYWTTQSANETARRLYDRIARKTDFIKYERAL